MHDGIHLEKAGIPSATICTDRFTDTAIGMAKNLPTPAQAMLFAEKFPACGSVIVMRDKNLGVPCSKGISNNFHFVFPMTAMFPHKVPTAYFFADAFVALDDLLDGHLLKGTLDKNKDDAAAVREQKWFSPFRKARNSSTSSPTRVI